MDALDVVRSLAVDLTASLAAADRHRRILTAIRQVVPCDAACLLIAQGDAFVPLAAHGLTKDAIGRIYPRKAHPRLDIIAGRSDPIRFAPDTALPDPFDGLLEADPTALAHVHACLGAPLRIEGELVGLLTADALDPNAFDGLDERVIASVAALAAAAIRTSRLIDALEASTKKLGLVARDLMRSTEEREGNPMIGTSEAMERLRREIELVARADFTVLITGETGSGKELIARAIHAASRRKDAALIYVNCAALPESIVESELFGHLRGAFTGADRERAGKFEVADGGTLFLDEIGELPLNVQPKLLRVLQEGEIQRVGDDRTRHVDVRVLAATNRDLKAAVEAGRFRADLFHRLNVYPIRAPSLSERREDIALLAGHFLDRARLKLGLGPLRLTKAARAALEAHDWPGNVRELENEIYRAALRAAEGAKRGDAIIIEPHHLGALPEKSASPAAPASPDRERPLRERIDEYTRREIQRAVEAHGGNWAAAARALGMHRSNLHHLAKRVGLR